MMEVPMLNYESFYVMADDARHAVKIVETAVSDKTRDLHSVFIERNKSGSFTVRIVYLSVA